MYFLSAISVTVHVAAATIQKSVNPVKPKGYLALGYLTKILAHINIKRVGSLPFHKSYGSNEVHIGHGETSVLFFLS